MNTFILHHKKTISLLTLIIANSIPLIWLLFFEGNPESILITYWVETGIIGIFAILRILVVGKLIGILYSAFLFIHFALFLLIQAVCLMVFTGNDFDTFANVPVLSAVLFLSHGVTYIIHFLLPNNVERRKSLAYYFLQPNVHIFAIWAVIIIGALLLESTGSILYTGALVIIVKLLLDIVFHHQEYNK